MLVVRMIDFRRAVRVCVMLESVGLAVQVHHQQVGAKGVTQHLLVQHFRRFAEGNQSPVEAGRFVAP